MFRRSLRSFVAVPVAAAALAASLLVAPTATAAGSPPVTGLAAIPQPPKKVTIVWDEYSDFTVDHYEVTVNPGSRFKQVPAGVTSTSLDDLGWSVNYTATVVAVDSVGMQSEPAELTLRGTKLVGRIDPSSARRGQNATVSGSLKWRDDAPIANAKVVVMRAFFPAPFPSSGFKKVGTVDTNNRGRFSLSTPAVQNAQYRVLYRGEPATDPTVGGWDSNINLSVTTPITLSMSPNPVSVGKKVRFSGKVKAPARLVAGGTIRLQHRDAGRWRTVKSGTIKAEGTYSMAFQPRSRSDQAWRVTTQRSDYFAASSSKAKVLVVN